MPRLPSALGLGGAKRTGGLDWTLDPTMRSDSPNSPNPPSPVAPPPRKVGQPNQISLRINKKLIHSPLEGK
eukprot:scaffold2645_cov112-Isochrysis_galbana.AAC.17